MIPITQSRTGKSGNCFSACIASILELPLQVVPDFVDAGDGMLDAANEWLAQRGYKYEQVPIGGVAPVGYHTIEGLSPRGGQHACVAKDGELVHDPHPQDGTGRGLVKPDRYGLIMPLGRATDAALVRIKDVRRLIDEGGKVVFMWATGVHNLITKSGEVLPMDGNTYDGFLQTVAPTLRKSKTGSTGPKKDLVITWRK